jgi:hypothetical protein
MMRARPLAVLVALAALAGPTAAQTPTESVWQASSGLLPTQVCPAWTLTDTSASDPVLAPSGLTISDTTGEDLFYVQTDALNVVPVPDPIVVEARMRFISGTSSANNRAPANVVITTAADTGTLFGIGPDEIFLTGVGDVRTQTASVDTDGASHIYRVEVTAAGAVTVFYDGIATLTGTIYMSADAFGPVRRIIWGEGSHIASGAHVWESVAHNLATCPSGTTSTTTTLASATTSTTLPSPDCDDNVAPGTVNTVRCRLGVLADQIAAAKGLGQFRAKLQSTLTQASGHVDQAVSACETGDDKTASRRMKQTGKFLQKMTHRLSGLPARKKVDAGLRADLTQVIESIRGDVGSLRKRPCGAS